MAQNALVAYGRAHVFQDYMPYGDARLKVNRDLRDRIETFLYDHRKGIEEGRIDCLRRREHSFTRVIDHDLGENTFDRDKVATIIRTWIVREFGGTLGLDYYEVTQFGSRIRFNV